MKYKILFGGRMSEEKQKPPTKFDLVMVVIIMLGLLAFIAYIWGGM